MVSSVLSDSSWTRGVMSSSAVRSPKRSERSSSSAVDVSSVPLSALALTIEPSSCGERAERSSSCGSTPNLRTRKFALLFISVMSQRNRAENREW